MQQRRVLVASVHFPSVWSAPLWGGQSQAARALRGLRRHLEPVPIDSRLFAAAVAVLGVFAAARGGGRRSPSRTIHMRVTVVRDMTRRPKSQHAIGPGARSFSVRHNRSTACVGEVGVGWTAQVDQDHFPKRDHRAVSPIARAQAAPRPCFGGRGHSDPLAINKSTREWIALRAILFSWL